MGDCEDKFEQIINSINSLECIPLNSIPDIELYIDQITTFMDDKLKNYKRNEDDKILTKAMINNYTKAKLIVPPNKKKYSKNHMIFLILIYHLKSILSINDIRILFDSINNISDDKNDKLEKIYNSFVEFQKDKSNILNSNLNLNNIDDETLILYVIMLVVQAENQKMLAEKIIDNFLFKK